MRFPLFALSLLIVACNACNDPDRSTSGDDVSYLSHALLLTSDPTEPWTDYIILAGFGFYGADGADPADVDGDGDMDIAACFEQGFPNSECGVGCLTVSLAPDDPLTGEWTNYVVARNLGAVEDAKWGDVDGDGCKDVIGACECGEVYVVFAPCVGGEIDFGEDWDLVTITAASGVQNWLQVAWTPGRLWAGGRIGSPASVGYFTTTDARDPDAWTYVQVDTAGWVMSLKPMDVDGDTDLDVVISDKSSAVGKKGSRWIEDDGSPPWVNHAIGNPGGDPGFLAIGDMGGSSAPDIVDGKKNTATGNAMFIRTNNGSWTGWSASQLPEPANVGEYQGIDIGDVTCDGVLDLVVAYSSAPLELSGLVALDGADSWSRIEISVVGTKFDNSVIYDVDHDGGNDIVQTEQIEQLGLRWYDAQCFP